MTCSEIINGYVWHDSLVENLEYLELKKSIIVSVELGNWKQMDYKNGDPNILKCTLEFANVSAFSHEPQDLIYNDDEILSFEVSESEGLEKIKLVLLGDSDIKVITFVSDGATINFF